MKYSNNFIKRSSLRRFITTLVTIGAFVYQTLLPAYAAILPNDIIERDLDNNALFERLVNNAIQQYATSPYVDVKAPEGATDLKSFHETLRETYPHALGEPIYIPIDTDGITTIIPFHAEKKWIGDALVQSRYIRAQINALLGRNLIDTTKDGSDPDDLQTNYSTEKDQLISLYKGAENYINSVPGKRLGDNLGLNQDNSGLAQNMVWPELRTIHGEDVLVPIVYLTDATVTAQKVDANNTQFNNLVSLSELMVDGTTIRLGKDAFLSIVNNLINNGGNILGSGDLQIRIGGELQNLSGFISAEGDLVIGAKSITSQTIVHRYDYGNGQAAYFGEIASIDSQDGSVVLRANENILLFGTEVSAGQDIKFGADGSIYIGTVEITNTFSGSEGGWRTAQRSTVEYLGSSLTAEESIELIAGGQIVIDASEITATNGHIEILAGLGITVQDKLNVTQTDYKGKFGKTSKEVSTYKTVAMRSLLDAGKDINIHASFGDISLKAVDISSTQGTSVTADNGGVNLLVTTENDHYNYNSITKKLFTVKTINEGHRIDNVVSNTIVGGLDVQAKSGIQVEFEGDPDLELEQQLDKLQSMHGFKWIEDVRGQISSEDWTLVKSTHDFWRDKKTTLSPAAMALISIAAAAVIGPAVANALPGAGAAAGTLTSVTHAAGAAAITSLSSAAILSSANALVNGEGLEGSLNSAFETITSSEALRAAAIAAVTAGAIEAIDADFFNTTSKDAADSRLMEIARDADGNILTDLAGNTQYELSFLGQSVQALSHAAVSAASTTIINGGSVDDFGDNLASTFVSNALSQVAKNYAGKIGKAYNGGDGDISNAARYIAHAALGCAYGAAETAIEAGDSEMGCVSGAGGAVIAEATADLYVEMTTTAGGLIRKEVDLKYGEVERKLYLWKKKGVDISKFLAALSVASLGGDPRIAALTGANAAENNSLGDDTVEAIRQRTNETIKWLASINQSLRLLETNQGIILINSAVYSNYHEDLSSLDGNHIRTQWFAAAAEVTSLFGLGALDTGDLPSLVTPLTFAAEDMLEYVHFKLATDNQVLYETLILGVEIPGYEGLRGEQLDLALVNKEQELVEIYTNEFFELNPNLDREEAFASINLSFDPESWLFDFNGNTVKEVIRTDFFEQNIQFDIGNKEHRIILGHGVVRVLRQE